MNGNIPKERYDSLRDSLEVVQANRPLMDSKSEAYSGQVMLADHLKDVLYDGVYGNDSLKDDAGEDKREYREEHGWTFDAYESYETVGAETLDALTEGLDKELLPRDGKENNVGDRGLYDKYRIPTVDGEMLTLKVTSEEAAEKAIEQVDEWLAQEEFSTTEKSQEQTTQTAQATGNSGEAEPAEEGSLRANLEQLPGVSNGRSEEIAQVLRQSPELFEAIAGNLDYVESVETDFDPLDRLSEDQRDMAEDLQEQGWSDEEIIENFL